MRKGELFFCLVLIGLIMAVASSTVHAAGVGVSPPIVSVDNALRGGEYECIITVFNTADEDGEYKLNATGPGSEWITFYRTEDLITPITSIPIKGLYIFSWDNVPGNDSERLLRFLWDDLALEWARNAEICKYYGSIHIVKDGNSATITLDALNEIATLTISDGRTLDLYVKEKNGRLAILRWHSEQRILLRIKIADDAPKDVYNSTIYILSIPPEATVCEGAGVHTRVQVAVFASIQVVSTQILEGTVKSITTTDTEIGYPLKIKVKVQNGGNVVARPTISCCITKNNTLVNRTLVDTSVHGETGIKPGKVDTIIVLWNTTGKEPGDYLASVTVSLDEETLATKDLPFKILPPGTLTREGELKSLFIEGEPLVNSSIKVTAKFENTGKVDTEVKFRGEVYHNGEFVDILKGDEKLIEFGETFNLVLYYTITIPGDYQIKGYVIYDGKETEAKEVSFTVSA